MSTLPPDEIPPVEPIEYPSRNELELARAQARVAELEAKVQAEREARDQASTAMRALAISLHSNFCIEKHDGTGLCQWYSDSNADSPTTADFTQADHWRWILIVHGAVWAARENGWTIVEPEIQEE